MCLQFFPTSKKSTAVSMYMPITNIFTLVEFVQEHGFPVTVKSSSPEQAKKSYTLKTQFDLGEFLVNGVKPKLIVEKLLSF